MPPIHFKIPKRDAKELFDEPSAPNVFWVKQRFNMGMLPEDELKRKMEEIIDSMSSDKN